MKTIEITDEMFEKLSDISKELNNQDHRATRMPYVFQIRQTKKINCQEWHEDWFLLISNEYWELEFKNYKKIIEFLKEHDEFESFETAINEIIENNKIYSSAWDEYNYDEIIDLISDKLELSKWYYKNVADFSNAFFTEKWIKEHIKANHYHYEEKTDDYLTFLNRNPEMETVMQFLCELSWWKLHL